MKSSTMIVSALIFIGSAFFIACGGDGVKEETKKVDVEDLTKNQPEIHGERIDEDDISLGHPLNAEWVTLGKGIYELKCQSCHKLTEERLVGPGWKDVTKRREPAWIMNMITNVDMMLDSDPEAQKLLEQCLVRMPNQNITEDDARKVLEFMRSNDGEK